MARAASIGAPTQGVLDAVLLLEDGDVSGASAKLSAAAALQAERADASDSGVALSVSGEPFFRMSAGFAAMFGAGGPLEFVKEGPLGSVLRAIPTFQGIGFEWNKSRSYRPLTSSTINPQSPIPNP